MRSAGEAFKREIFKSPVSKTNDALRSGLEARASAAPVHETPGLREKLPAAPRMHHGIELATAPRVNSVIDWVSWIYLVTNTLRIFFYAPQIRAVFRCADGASAVSITTWAFWSFANVTAALYGWLVVHDHGFTAIFIGNALCTTAVTSIAALKRLSLRRA
jgi:hypothetical protein